MANAFLNEQIFANTMLLLVTNNTVMGNLVDTKFTNQVTDKNGLRINVKRPPRFLMTSGPTLDLQDIVSGSISIDVDQYSGVHVAVTDLQGIQSYNELLHSQVMKSAASALTQGLDSYLHTFVQRFPSWVNAPGASALDRPLATIQQEIPIWTRLENLAVPTTDRVGFMTAVDSAGVQGSLIDKFMSAEASAAMKKAQVPMLSDIDYYRTQAPSVLTTGTRAVATTLVNGANQFSNYLAVKDTMVQNLVVDGAAAGATYRRGEVFTIAGVFRTNPRTGALVTDAAGNTELMQFTLVADAVADGSGNATLQFTPPIIVNTQSGSIETQRLNAVFQTCSAVPADNAALAWAGNPSSNFQQRAAWHKSAIQLVSARLVTPTTGICAFASDPDTGISIRYWRGSDIATGLHIHRWDMAYGAEVVDGLLGTRFNGA
jgi:hypothetical protein